MIGFLQGPDGEKSSKRLLGTIAGFFGIMILVAMAIYGFIAVVPHIEAVRGAGYTLLIAGGALLGVSKMVDKLTGGK